MHQSEDHDETEVTVHQCEDFNENELTMEAKVAVEARVAVDVEVRAAEIEMDTAEVVVSPRAVVGEDLYENEGTVYQCEDLYETEGKIELRFKIVN